MNSIPDNVVSFPDVKATAITPDTVPYTPQQLADVMIANDLSAMEARQLLESGDVASSQSSTGAVVIDFATRKRLS